MIRRLFLFSLATVFCGLPPAFSQTVLGGYSPPPGVTSQTGTPPAGGSFSPRPAGRQFVDSGTLERADANQQGEYPPLERVGGGQIQEAWNTSKPTDGVYRAHSCGGECVVKIRLREFMVTHIVLPEGQHIRTADIGDPTAFVMEPRGTNGLAVKPLQFGTDTNLQIWTQSGSLYSLYLRAEGYNSNNIPDLVVYLYDPTGLRHVPAPPAALANRTASAQAGNTGMAYDPLTLPRSQETLDFVTERPFDPGKLHGWDDYTVFGSSETMAPSRVFRDDLFTYVQWDDWDSLELPAAYVVVDGIDEVINTRVSGQTLIIEAVAELIALKSGTEYLCLVYQAEEKAR